MKNLSNLSCFVWLFVCSLFIGTANAQTITWTDVTESQTTLPDGVKLYKGTRDTPKLQAWLLEVDLNNENLAVRSYIGSNTLVPNHVKNNEAFAAINGGYFGGSTSYSAVVYPGELKAKNVGALTRNGNSYPVMRSLFSINTNFECSVDWIYHYGEQTDDIYTFSAPMNYKYNDPTPKTAPDKNNGGAYTDILTGIGGGPVLIKNGEKNITYNQEIMWGSGVGLDNRDPRTAVGYTDDNHVYMFVADGRQSSVSEGVSLSELADILLEYDCIGAVNLDGGGSSGMAVGGQFVSSPSEQRSVPSILAVTTRDKVKMPGIPDFEEIIDTDDEEAEKIGTGWFETANDGYYGASKSLLAEKGTGQNYYKFNITPPADVYSEVYGWWVSASNRAKDTPFIIKHKYGEETVTVDQTQNGMSWAYIGEFVFAGDGTDYVTVSDEATVGTYVVADAVRVISFGEEEQVSAIEDTHNETLFQIQCYPNPVKKQANITFQLPSTSFVSLKIFNSNGKQISMLENRKLPAGKFNYKFDTNQWANGMYFYSLTIDNKVYASKIIVK